MSTKANPPPEDSEHKPEEREEAEYSYPALKLHQNGHVIYFTTIPIDDLFPYTFVERHNENPEEGYQRKYDERRAIEIAEYLSTDGESIPINIVLSAQPAAELTPTSKPASEPAPATDQAQRGRDHYYCAAAIPDLKNSSRRRADAKCGRAAIKRGRATSFAAAFCRTTRHSLRENPRCRTLPSLLRRHISITPNHGPNVVHLSAFGPN